jgi:ABC-type multidrug transport system ATPase subunit
VGIDNNLTVRQNLAFWAPIYGLRGAQARARIDELLAQLDLLAKAEAWPMHISAGQRQRLALARSLLARNRLVFLDEPTNKLDLEGVRSVRAMIADLNRAHGVTIVLTTHVMEEAEELCGEIALLRQGALVTHQRTADLTRSLGLARPIAITVRRPPDGAARDEGDWFAELRTLPGVTRVQDVNGGDQGDAVRGTVHEPAADAATTRPAADGDVQLTLESVDPWSTTPALLAWVRARQLHVINMRAEPVTLADVFVALTGSGSVSETPDGIAAGQPHTNSSEVTAGQADATREEVENARERG